MAAPLLATLKAIVAGMRTLGVVEPVTLRRRTGTDTFTDERYGDAYVSPQDQTTGLAGDGAPAQRGVIHLYTLNGERAPQADDKITDNSGRTWLIVGVRTSYGALKHDCTCVRML